MTFRHGRTIRKNPHLQFQGKPHHRPSDQFHDPSARVRARRRSHRTDRTDALARTGRPVAPGHGHDLGLRVSEPAGTSIAAIVSHAAAALEAAGLGNLAARQDAAVLARHVLGWDLAHWLGHQRDAAPDGFDAAFVQLVARRAAREPVAYITGEREFYWRTRVLLARLCSVASRADSTARNRTHHRRSDPGLRRVPFS